MIHKLHYFVNRGTCQTRLEPIENVMKRCTKQIYLYYPCLRGTISNVIDRCTEWFLIHVFLLKMAFDFSHCYSVLGIQIFVSHTNPSYSLWSISFFCCFFILIYEVDSGLEMVHENTFSLPFKMN